MNTITNNLNLGYLLENFVLERCKFVNLSEVSEEVESILSILRINFFSVALHKFYFGLDFGCSFFLFWDFTLLNIVLNSFSKLLTNISTAMENEKKIENF